MPLQEKDKNQFFDEMNFENSSIYYSLICSEPEKNEKLGTFIMHHSKKKKKKNQKYTKGAPNAELRNLWKSEWKISRQLQ